MRAWKRGLLSAAIAVAALIGLLSFTLWWIFASPHTWNNLGTERGRYQRTRADMLALANTLKAYAEAHQGHVPAGTMEAESLRRVLEPTYSRHVPTHDAWGHPLQYSSDGVHSEIASFGRDGSSDPSQEGPIFDRDFMIRDGKEIRTDLVVLVEKCGP